MGKQDTKGRGWLMGEAQRTGLIEHPDNKALEPLSPYFGHCGHYSFTPNDLDAARHYVADHDKGP